MVRFEINTNKKSIIYVLCNAVVIFIININITIMCSVLVCRWCHKKTLFFFILPYYKTL